MNSDYAKDYSPCCHDSGHRPTGSKGRVFFCMACGATYESDKSE